MRSLRRPPVSATIQANNMTSGLSSHQDQLLRAAGPVNRGVFKRICDLSNEELAPLVNDLRDYPYPTTRGYVVPIEHGTRCSLDAIREIACSFGDVPRMEEQQLKQHGECLIGFAKTIQHLSSMSLPTETRPVAPVERRLQALTPSERALQMRKKER